MPPEQRSVQDASWWRIEVGYEHDILQNAILKRVAFCFWQRP
jgi:hypothetical protein